MELRERLASLLGADWRDSRLSLIEDSPAGVPNLRHLTFETGEGELVRGYYLPSQSGAAVLYCHAHGNRYDIGIEELIEGRPALHGPWLPEFVKMGIGVLCIEMPCFGSRSSPDESARSKAKLWQGRTLFGQMLGEQRAAMDWLRQAPGVNAERIAAMGVSMGGTLAWWLGAMQPGFAAIVSIACFADMRSLIEAGAHDSHGIYMVVPGLLDVASTGRICGLAAPTPLLHCVGLQDWSTPPLAFDRARSDLDSVYENIAAPAPQFEIDTHAEHEETVEMRVSIKKFIQSKLVQDFL